MKQLTIRVPEDTLEEIEDLAAERDSSKSEVAREYLQLGSEYGDLQTENERLRTRVQKLIDMHEQHDELVKHVEQEQALQTKRHNASVVQRAKWFVFGGSEGE